jgi:CheY-like chemotaxis protein
VKLGRFPATALSCEHGVETRASQQIARLKVGRGDCGLESRLRKRFGRGTLKDSKTILICEDEPTLRELVRASLDGGYRFAEASDGFVALRLAQELAPDAVILDLMLPGLSGFEVLARLRGDDRLRDTRVLVITAWSERREDVIAAGADEFLPKPFDPNELRAKLDALLGGP